MLLQAATLDAGVLQAAFAVRLADIHAKQQRHEDAEVQLAHAAASLAATSAHEPDQAAALLLRARMQLVHSELARQQECLAEACEQCEAAAESLQAALEPGGLANGAAKGVSVGAEAARGKGRGRRKGQPEDRAPGRGPGSGHGMQWQLRAALAQARLQQADCHARLGQWHEAAGRCEEAAQACAGLGEQGFPLQMAAVHLCRARIQAGISAEGQSAVCDKAAAALQSTSAAPAEGRRGKAGPQKAGAGTAVPRGACNDKLLQQASLLLEANAVCSEVPALFRCYTVLPCTLNPP